MFCSSLFVSAAERSALSVLSVSASAETLTDSETVPISSAIVPAEILSFASTVRSFSSAFLNPGFSP